MAEDIGMMNAAKAIYKSPNVVCSKCGSKVFREALILKRVSAIVSPTGREELYPIPVYSTIQVNEKPKQLVGFYYTIII